MFIGKVKKLLDLEELDEETTRMVERMVVLRVSTKHIDLWIRQLEMKRDGRAGRVDEALWCQGRDWK